jgi:CHAT domain-containing protein/tetratricopeptide (TPR) repeat protein
MDAGRPTSDEEWAQAPEQIDQLIAQGHYQAALDLARPLVDRTETAFGTNSVEFARQLIRLGDVYLQLKQVADAEPAYRKAVEIFSRSGGEHDVEVSTSLNGLATTLIEKREYAGAEPLLRRALEIDEKTLDENTDYRSQTLSNLGMLKFYDGKYSEAEPLLRQTVEARSRRYGENDSRVADSLNNLAAVYQAINDITEAEALLKRALQIRRDHGSALDVAQSLNNLALCYRYAGRYEEAEPLYQRAVAIYRAELDEHHPRLATVLSNLAGVYFALGKYDRAEPLVSQALAIRKAFGDQAWAIGATLNNLARLRYAAGRYDEAEALYVEAIAAGRRSMGDRHPRLRTTLSNLAELYVAMKRPDDAMALMLEVIAIDDGLIANVFPMASEKQRLEYLVSLQQNLDDILCLVSRHFVNSSSVVAEGFDIVLRRKGIVAESLAARRDELVSGRYPSLEPRIREWRRLRASLAEETLAGPGADGIDQHKMRLEQLARDTDRVEVEIARGVPEASMDQRLNAADRQHVSQVLTNSDVLVEFVRFFARDFGAAPRTQGSTHYAAFVLEGGKPDSVRLVDLGEAESIDELVFQFRTSISSPPTWFSRVVEGMRRRFRPDHGARLRSKIFDPLNLGSSRNQRLFLATEGTLAWIPFEALPGNGNHLIDDYRISYLSAGRDLLRFGLTAPVAAGDALVMANPNFDLRDGDASTRTATDRHTETQSRDLTPSIYFPPLEKTRAEGERISGMLGVRPFLWDAAVEGHLKASRSPRVLHLATHGFFLPNQPPVANASRQSSATAGWIGEGRTRLTGPSIENPMLRSGLALAGANTWLARGSTPSDAEDGILNAVDVSSLDLAGTDLAVLSACETGLGAAHVWEGVFGLRRAFALAGARTLVMSLWKVADEQTAELMLDFYQRLLSGRPRAEALRCAQLELRKSYRSPFFWAAFICQGEPGPLRMPNHG